MFDGYIAGLENVMVKILQLDNTLTVRLINVYCILLCGIDIHFHKVLTKDT